MPGVILAQLTSGELLSRCRRLDSNQHEEFTSQDFKSCASPIPPRRLLTQLPTPNNRLTNQITRRHNFSICYKLIVGCCANLRRVPESNRCTGICSPLPNHSANAPPTRLFPTPLFLSCAASPQSAPPLPCPHPRQILCAAPASCGASGLIDTARRQHVFLTP